MARTSPVGSLAFLALSFACGAAPAQTPVTAVASVSASAPASGDAPALYVLPPLATRLAQAGHAPLVRDPAPAAALEAPAAPDKSTRIVAFLSAGVGAVGVGVGVAYGIAAISKKVDSDKHCDSKDACDTTGLSEQHAGLRDASFATAFFVGGAALLGTGVLLIVATPSATKAGDARAVGLRVGPAGASLAGSF